MKMVLPLDYEEIKSIESALVFYMNNLDFDERFTTRKEAKAIEDRYTSILERIQKLKADSVSVSLPKAIFPQLKQ